MIGKAFEIFKYRDISKWSYIKSYFLEAYKAQQYDFGNNYAVNFKDVRPNIQKQDLFCVWENLKGAKLLYYC